MPAPLPIEPSDASSEPVADVTASAAANVAKDLLLASGEESLQTSAAPTINADEVFSEKRPSLPDTKASSTTETRDSTSRFLSTSLQTQEELSAQLAQMASQLKQNSLRFTDALARDRAVMEGAEERLEGNLTKLQKERTRLKVQSGKSGSTTWMVLGAIITVVLAWIFTFLLIRVT